jgi:NAD+ synthase
MSRTVILGKKYLIIWIFLWLGAAFLLTLWPYNITFHNSVTASAGGGLHFESPSIAYLRQPPPKLYELKNFSIFAEVKPDSLSAGKDGIIFGYSHDNILQNFLVRQVGSEIGFYLAGKNEVYDLWLNVFEKDQSVLIAITYDGEKITIFKNESIQNVITAKNIDFSSWNSSFPFVLANTGYGNMSWSGTLYSLDIFDRVVTISKDRQLESIRNLTPPILSLSFHHTETGSPGKNGNNSLEALVIPAMFIPPAKGFISSAAALLDIGKWDFSDIFLNILFFVPLGLLLKPLLEMYTKRYSLSFWLTVITGFLLSLMIESLQILIPNRDTSVLDVLSNTAGTIAGSSLFMFSYIRRIFHLRSRGFMHNPQNWLKINTTSEIEKITKTIHFQVRSVLRKKGAIVAVSGGVDSSVCAALCTKALGKENVYALSMPERDSSPDSLRLGQQLADALGIKLFKEDITPILIGAKCYELQIEAIRKIFPEYGEGWKQKVTLPSILESDRLNLTHLTVQSPDGVQQSSRIPLQAYLQLIAATNLKQRIRKITEYLYADRFNYAVCGTPNRLEYDQGFFVKQGDGSADFKPIAHLYKSQVYQLAEALDIPDEIRKRPPTTETFSLPQTQEEFYFSLPYGQMDICLYGYNHHFPSPETARAAQLTTEQVERVYKDIEKKRRTTLPLHLPPLLIKDVAEISNLIQTAIYQSKEE